MTAEASALNYTTIKAAAEMLGVCQRTIRRYIADGDLPAYRFGRHFIRINLADLEKLLHPMGEPLPKPHGR